MFCMKSPRREITYEIRRGQLQYKKRAFRAKILKGLHKFFVALPGGLEKLQFQYFFFFFFFFLLVFFHFSLFLSMTLGNRKYLVF